MAPVWRSLVTRDGPGTTDEGNHMSTGAIIGIACGAGALFLGSVILFVIYWRRQRRYNAEDDYYPGRDDGAQFNSPTANPIYTLDYKGEETVETASYAATPQTSHTGRSGFTPLVEMASAMPTHPAYIPRALVRPGGSGRGTPSTMSPSSGTTSHFSPLSSRQQPQQQPQQRIEPEDVMARTFINIGHDPNERGPATNSEESEADTLVESRNRYDQRRHPSGNSGAPIPIPVPVPVPAHIMQQPTYPPAARRKQYSPPRLNINTQAQQSKYINSTQPAIPRERVPISAVDISGPLAFPPQPPPPPPPVLELGGPRQQHEHHQQYQKELDLQFQDEQRYHNNNYYEESPASGTATDGPYRGGPRGRSFRDRSLSSRGGTSRSRSNRGADRSAVGGGGGDWYYASSSSNNGGRQGQQYQHHKETHYEEVEIGRNSDDDIW